LLAKAIDTDHYGKTNTSVCNDAKLIVARVDVAGERNVEDRLLIGGAGL
jgi:hypothetical protein